LVPPVGLITEALRRLDDAARKLRYHIFAELGQSIQPVQMPGPIRAGRIPRSCGERPGAAETTALLER
jgi:hypothetical protein